MTSITDVLGVLTGHAQDNEALADCTVILTIEGAVDAVVQSAWRGNRSDGENPGEAARNDVQRRFMEETRGG